MTCGATTAAGKPCRRPALRGAEVCHAHAESPSGRPDELTEETQRRIVAALGAGNYREAAARAAGVSRSTLYRWLARGEREPAGKYGSFREELVRAEAAAEVRSVANIARAGESNWRAEAWRLERKHPGRWGRGQSSPTAGVGLSPAVGHADVSAAVDVSRLSTDELRALRALYAKAAGRA